MTEADIFALLKNILFPSNGTFARSGNERVLDYQVTPDGVFSVAAQDGIKQIGALIDPDSGDFQTRILNPQLAALLRK